ncbi:hypothetical protein OIE67_21475 [Nonomuraea fuscirosea]|uniref:hypothetical protein n=1 Tax=Nonomuraea fuscirosea TaxID=1291556 RepID=UPI002DDC4FF3|nr:hypothetical protein [Nonomuraea fuscirosea]WSA57086.1 hypothetical protein OIE67_21475 [Nonomuraea fuscirosea]
MFGNRDFSGASLSAALLMFATGAVQLTLVVSGMLVIAAGFWILRLVLKERGGNRRLRKK